MNKTVLSTSGSVLSALLASLCCIAPLALSIIGAGSLGFATMFEPYRPYLMLLTFAFLGSGFYFTYRTCEVTCDDGVCKQESADTFTKVLLWVAAIIALIFLFFPQILSTL